ncbi:MAG: 2-oxoacid:acceptor oxidoreductase subunit alpha [Phycisphaerae bacterium]|nr:2-oxoacid:acceptor oxidoreductase subunit alpha [Phycisphaerae bacterium]
MTTNELSFMVGGAAGVGIKTAGLVFARLCSRAGLHVFGNVEYPSIIRGDHNSYQVMVSRKRVFGHTRVLDVLLALDDLSIELHRDEIRPGGAIVYDVEKSAVDKEALEKLGVLPVGLPFQGIIKEVGGEQLLLNTVGIGATMGLLRFDFDAIASTLEDTFARHGPDVLKQNLDAARRAYDAASDGFSDRFDVTLKREDTPKRMLLTGNEAVAMGAIKAGVKFYAGYPMTPSSSILSYMAAHERECGLVVKHAEDEISAAGMAVGAAFAGARSMTATSGGGFSLMCEFVGLAGMTETPLVIVESQRPGPSTGLPTRSEQSDLKFVLSASQGEFPRIVIAPGDPEESFRLAFEAFNLAERYQTPVILLMDKHLSESTWTFEPFDTSGMAVDRGARLDEAALASMTEYKRYACAESGISPRVAPGTPGGAFCATSDEHDERGDICEDEPVRSMMMEKRLRKTDSLDVSECGWKLHGESEADLMIVGWGSTTSAIRGAIDLLAENGTRIGLLQVIFLSPFPSEQVADVLGKANRVIVVENNATAQLAGVIRENTGIQIEDAVLKYSGRQWLVDELAEQIRRRL